MLYHSSYTSAIDSALKFAVSEGFTTDKEETAVVIGFKSLRPKEGKTERISVPVYKNGKLQRKALQIQIYNRGNNVGNNFELNRYIA